MSHSAMTILCYSVPQLRRAGKSFQRGISCLIHLRYDKIENNDWSMLMAVTTAADQAYPGSKHNIQNARQAYYDKISQYHLTPLWEVLKGLVTPEPKTQMLPALWKFAQVEKLMLEAGEVITAEEAERRVLVLENPGDPGNSRITNSLFAGIQLIMPGEIAEAHQHVSSAIRFVLK